MKNTYKAFAFLLTLLMVASVFPTAVPTGVNVVVSPGESTHTNAATNLVVTNETINQGGEFNDDDFEFFVYNGSLPISTANVTLTNNTDGAFHESKLTDGTGKAQFFNVPVGVWHWNVTWAAEPDMYENGTMVSDGPEVFWDDVFGNLDWENDDDDMNVTFTDIDNNPADGLNFTIKFRDNITIWNQMILGTDGVASYYDIPIENYTWYITVDSGPYDGTVLDVQNFTTDGTTLLIQQILAQFTGDENHQDLEVYTYFETTIAPLVGAVIELMYYNGSVIDTQTTPTNGTVRFIDLPVAYVNVTATFSGDPIGVGMWGYNLTTIGSDIRDPTITGPDDQDYLIGTENITLTWQIDDEYPDAFVILVDGVTNTTIDWTNQTEYTFNATGMPIAVYNITLVADDQNGNSEFDSVMLTIYEAVDPVIDGPDDLEYYFTETGYTLQWNITDEYMNNYTITLDGDDLSSGELDPDSPFILISVDGLSIGVHVYIFMANDTSGNSATDSVTVTVIIDNVAPVITYEPDTVSYAQGDINIIRNWTAADEYMDYYTIKVDGFVIETGVWDSEIINFDFSGLLAGVHSVELTVYDLGGNTDSSVVEVVVSTPTAVTAMFLVIGIAASLIVVGLIYWRIKFH